MIVFLRHGQTDWNSRGLLQGRDDIPLNKEIKNTDDVIIQRKRGR